MKHILQISFIVFVSLGLSLIGAEIVLRYFGPQILSLADIVQNVQDPRYYVLKPDATMQSGGLYEKLPRPVLWKINAQGMRSDRPVDLQSERYRIMIYGDSEVFGMSVPIEDTIARQMEVLDSRIEVLNLGVFGYNASQAAEHIERTSTLYRPDLIIYVINENDTYDAIRPMKFIFSSKILQIIYFLYRVYHVEPEQRRLRYSADRILELNRQLGRVATWCAQHNVPVVFAFFKWNRKPAQLINLKGRYWPENLKRNKFRLIAMDLDAATAGESKLDHHLTLSGYRKIAAALCDAISGLVASGCTPPGS